MLDVSPRRRRLLLFLGALLALAAAITFRPQRASSPRDTSAEEGGTRADRQPTTRAAAAASASATAANTDEWREPKKREGINAANLYADAFVLLGQLTEEERNIIRKASEEVDADKAAQLYEKLQAIMTLLREATKADYCDWGFGVLTPETSLVHLGNVQVLGKLALWAAAYRFPTDPLGAIEDLGVRAQLGHHLSDTLIGMLIASSHENSANNLLRDHMISLDAAATGKALDFIAASPLDADMTRVIGGEIEMGESWWQRFERMSPQERGKEILQLDDDTPSSPRIWDEAKALATGLLFTPARLAEEMVLLRGVQAGTAEAMRMPEAEFQQWWKAAEAQLSGTSVAKFVLPSYEGIQRQLQKLRVERTLLTAAADIQQNGTAQIGCYRDPATGGALIYVPTPAGFELRSPYQVKGKPVTMEFKR